MKAMETWSSGKFTTLLGAIYAGPGADLRPQLGVPGAENKMELVTVQQVRLCLVREGALCRALMLLGAGGHPRRAARHDGAHEHRPAALLHGGHIAPRCVARGRVRALTARAVVSVEPPQEDLILASHRAIRRAFGYDCWCQVRAACARTLSEHGPWRRAHKCAQPRR